MKHATIALSLVLLLHGPVWAQTSFQIGISVHLGSRPGKTTRQLGLIAQAGATSIRDDVSWDSVEQEKGHLAVPSGIEDEVNQTLQAHLEPLLILDYGNRFYDAGAKPTSPEALSAFTRYAAFVVGHFKGRVHFYEMWNEWNLTAGNTRDGKPEEYVRFIRVVYPAVKAVDPSAVFLAGAIGGSSRLGWLSRMLSAGAPGYFDGLSIHPYIFGKSRPTGDAWAKEMLATESVIHRYTAGQDLPIYVTEIGWPTYGGISQEAAGAYLAQMFLLARTMKFLKGIWWYDFRDDGWDKSNQENDFGLVNRDLTPKPAFTALTLVAPIVTDALQVEDLPTGNPSVRALRFRLNGSNQVLALWNTGQKATRLRVAGSGHLQVRSVEPNDSHGTDTSAKERLVDLSGIPVLVTGMNLEIVR
jgi:polysaccharide biosynthesis protein PslG